MEEMSATGRWLLRRFLHFQGLIKNIFMPEVLANSSFITGTRKFKRENSLGKEYFSHRRIKEYWERILSALLIMIFFLPLNWGWFLLFLPGLFFISILPDDGVLVLSWLIWSFFSALFSPKFPFVLAEVFQETILILAGFSAGVFSRGNRRWLHCFFLAAAVIIGLNILQIYALPIYPQSWVPAAERGAIPLRITGVFQNPNLNGIYLSFILPLLLAGWEMQEVDWSEKAKYSSGILFCLCLLSIIFTFSRTAWIAALAVLLCYWYPDKKANIIRLFLIIAMIFIIFPPLADRVLSISCQGNTFNYRVQIWKVTWDLVMEHPWTGVGRESLTYWLAHLPDFPAAHAHNHYLQIMAEKGMPALFIMLWIAYRLLFAYIGNTNSTGFSPMEKGIRVALFSQLVAGFTESIWVSPLPLFLFWFGVALIEDEKRNNYR